MSERYKKLYHLEHRLYASGAPVIVAAGALLRDAYSGGLLCQLKFRNIQPLPIKALRVLVQMLDVDGELLERPVSHRYLDLDLKQEEEFGRDVAIVLPSREARSFTVSVSQVSFTDGEIWKNTAAEWLPLEDQPTLAEYYGDPEVAVQFQIHCGTDCRYPVVLDKELWFCACGAVNPLSEGKCHVCRRRRSGLLDISEDALRAEARARLENERVQSSQEAQDARKRRKKRLIAAAVILPLVILATGAALTLPGMLARSHAYEDARVLLDDGNYDEAAAAFAALGDYRDSADYIGEKIPYRFAEELMTAAEANDSSALSRIGRNEDDLSEEVPASRLLYEAAAERFAALGDYADSAARRQSCLDALEAERLARLQAKYDDAAALLRDGSYSLARQAFLALGDYNDSAELAKEAVYKKALALYRFVEQYNVSALSALLSMDAEETSILSLPERKAEALGSEGMEALQAAFGKDSVEIRTEAAPDEALKPLPEALAALFASLPDYRDSEERAATLPEITDYTREFYLLCENGKLEEALAWLQAYEGEFQDREQWETRLTLYIPYCSKWTLYSGDPTLLPRITGREGSCYGFRSLVVLRGESATLRLLIPGDAEYSLDLNPATGETDFFYSADGFRYFAFISSGGRLGIIKWDISSICGSVEYQAAEAES